MFDAVVYFTAIVTAMASSILGVFLVLRKMSMTTDAISHTVLLGIVLSFLIVKDLDSPLLMIGATLMGIFTTYMIELLVKSKKTTEDAATGVIFPLLFAIAVIIISLDLRGVHIDNDAVLLGYLELVTESRLYIMIGVLVLNLIFFLVFYKELKLVSFDAALAAVLGIMPLVIHYLLMSLVSLTAVAAFDAVGSILVIALMIGPAATALLVTKNLFKAVMLSMGFAVLSATIGYFLGLATDLSMSGLIASTILVIFLTVLFFEPRAGIITTMYQRKNQKYEFAIMTLMMHIRNHQGTESEMIETNLETIDRELKWKHNFYTRCIDKAVLKGYIEKSGDMIRLTDVGEGYLSYKIEEYQLI